MEDFLCYQKVKMIYNIDLSVDFISVKCYTELVTFFTKGENNYGVF